MARSPYILIAAVGMAVAGGLAWLHESGRWSVASLVGAGSGAGVGSSGGSVNPAPAPAAGSRPNPGAPIAVEVATVRAMTLRSDAQSVGTLLSRQGVVVRPEVAGRIARLGFGDGQPVRRGQVLVQLDDALEAAEIQQAQAQLSIAQASVQRNRELVARNFVSQAALDETVANLQVAQARLQLAQARLQRMRIVAPFSGVAGIRQVNVGDFVGVGAAIVNLDDIAQLLLDFRLPERFLSGVREGQTTEVQVDALPGKAFTARVEAVDPQIDVNGRSVLVRARLDNPQGDLRPGMFARVRAVFGERTGAIMVPEEAVVPQGGRQWLIKAVQQSPPPGAANGTASVRLVSERVEVELGARRQGLVEILSGVQVGDTVVTAGHQRVPRDGMTLRVVQIGAPPPGDTTKEGAAPEGGGAASKDERARAASAV